jgi:hypothetical protein
LNVICTAIELVIRYMSRAFLLFRDMYRHRVYVP